MKDGVLYVVSLVSVVLLFLLYGHLAAPSDENSSDQQYIESVVSHGMIGLSIAFNLIIWWFLKPKKCNSKSRCVGRCVAFLLFSLINIGAIMAIFYGLGRIQVSEGNTLFGGEAGFAVIMSLGWVVIFTVANFIAYLFNQIGVQCSSK